jgi:hypothetical protein
MSSTNSTKTVWRKSSRSGGQSGQCVEIASLIRDTQIRG